MFFPVLTRKGKVPRLQFPQALAKRRGSLRGPLPCLGAFVQHPVWVLLPVPRPGWRGRSQLVVPSGPGYQTLPSHHHWGSQVPRTQLALRLFTLTGANHLWQIPVRWIPSSQQLSFFEKSANRRGGPELIMCSVLATYPWPLATS